MQKKRQKFALSIINDATNSMNDNNNNKIILSPTE